MDLACDVLHGLRWTRNWLELAINRLQRDQERCGSLVKRTSPLTAPQSVQAAVEQQTYEKSSEQAPAATQAPERAQDVQQSKPQAAEGCEAYRPIVSKYEWNVDTAMAVMQAESRCDPRAYNGHMNSDGSNDAGLFQINSIHVAGGLIDSEERFNPEANVRAAYAIYRGSGWRAWSAFNNGRYLEFRG